MSPVLIGSFGLVLLLVLMMVRVPVAIAMTVVGLIGLTILNSWAAAIATLVTEAWTVATFFELTVIPLFVLMGNIAGISGMSRDLYAAAHAWVGSLRGGLAHATVLGCTGFAALSGSSVASALTIGRVAMPEMARYGYDKKLSAGAVAAGGTLGILIPPSTGFVIYAILTEESIGRLFLAGILPGLLLASLFLLTIFIQTKIKPEIGPRADRLPIAEKMAALKRSASIVFIIFITIGGIYGGVFTPVEAAAVGAMLAFVFAFFRKSLALKPVSNALLQTVTTTVMIFLIIIGANIFSPFLALTGIPESLATTLFTFDLGPIGLLSIILGSFIFLGTFLDGFAMMVLVLPIVLPIIAQSKIPDMLGVSSASSDLKVWFGVIMVIVIEMAMISPPVGMNVFVVKGVSKGVSMKEIYIGILPFWLAMIVCLFVLIAFPQLALILPNTMIG
jgi:tripartite ATP-independent transporter DctM subunit